MVPCAFLQCHSWSSWNLEMLVFEVEGKSGVLGERFLGVRENQQETEPTYDIAAGTRTRATSVGSELACFRLSGSGEDAKEKGTRKVGSPVSSRFIFVFALSQFSGPDYLGAWNRLKASALTTAPSLGSLTGGGHS